MSITTARPHVARRAASRFGRMLALAFLSATLVGTAACSSDSKSSTDPDASIDGRYQLVEADGEDVDGQVEGEFEIDGDEWTMELAAGDGTVSDNGSLDKSGNDIEFSSDRFDDEFEGSVSGDRLTIDYNFGGETGEVELVFEK
jgi:hypothetical protein